LVTEALVCRNAKNPDLPAAQRARKAGPIIRIVVASRNLLIAPVHKRFFWEKEEGMDLKPVAARA
jgi:hypothetical protein